MAEMYFMVRHRVNYYIFTVRPANVPLIRLQKGRQMIIFKVRGMPAGRRFPYTAWRWSAILLSSASTRRWITLCVQMWTWSLVTMWAWRSSPPCLAPSIHLASTDWLRNTLNINAGLHHRPIFLKIRRAFITYIGPLIWGVHARGLQTCKACHGDDCWPGQSHRGHEMMRATWTNTCFITNHQDPFPWVYMGWSNTQLSESSQVQNLGPAIHQYRFRVMKRKNWWAKLPGMAQRGAMLS